MSESKAEKALRTLTERIENGTYPPDSRMPSISRIQEEFDLSRGVAAGVVSELRNIGLAVSKHGSGTFVRSFQPITRSSPARLASDRWNDGKAIQDIDTGKRPRSVDVVVSEGIPPTWASDLLNLESGESVVTRSRRFVVDDRSVQLATSYFPAELVRGSQIVYTDTGPGGAYARLAELGHRPVRFAERLRSRMPSREESEQLDLPPGTPVVEITRSAFDGDGDCVEVNHMILDATAYILEYAFDAEGVGKEREDFLKV